MVPGRVLLVAVLAIAVTFEQAVALQCRVCNSKENADCLSSPAKIAQTTCEVAESTTSGNVDTTTSGNVETTTSGNVETTTSGNVETTTSGNVDTTTSRNVDRTTSGNVETTTSGNVERTTSGNVETTTSENVERTTSENVERTTSGNVETTTSENVERTTSGKVKTTTSGNVETTTSENVERTTSGNVETTTSGNVETTTSENVERTTSGNVETTTSENVERTTSGKVKTTTSGNVETTTSENVETTTNLHKTDAPTTVPTPKKPTGNKGSANEIDGGSPNDVATYVSSPEARSSELAGYPSVHRLRRGVFLRDEASSVCFKLVYKDGETDVVERGCAPKSNDPCEKLKEPALKKDAGCYICEADGCNASSSISLGLTSIIVPALIMMFLRP